MASYAGGAREITRDDLSDAYRQGARDERERWVRFVDVAVEPWDVDRVHEALDGSLFAQPVRPFEIEERKPWLPVLVIVGVVLGSFLWTAGVMQVWAWLT
jgi:hypothetical protein